MRRLGRMAAMLAAVTLAGGLTIGLTGNAHADVIPSTNSWSEIFDPYTSAPACLDDPGGSTAVGTSLELWHCHGYDSQGAPQRWYFHLWGYEGPGDTWYSITKQDGLCVGANGTQAGARVVLQRCGFGPVWAVLSRNAYSGDPVFQLEWDGYSGYCMSLPDSTGGNAEPILLEPCGPGSILRYWSLG